MILTLATGVSTAVGAAAGSAASIGMGSAVSRALGTAAGSARDVAVSAAAVNPDGTPVSGGVTLIQVVLIAAILGVALLLNRSTADSRHQAIRRLLLLGFVVAAVVSVAVPSLLSRIAAFVGVGRGTDLLLYALVIAFLSYIATSLRRTRQLTSRITVLARELALAQARIEDGELRLQTDPHATTRRPTDGDPHGTTARPDPADDELRATPPRTDDPEPDSPAAPPRH